MAVPKKRKPAKDVVLEVVQHDRKIIAQWVKESADAYLAKANARGPQGHREAFVSGVLEELAMQIAGKYSTTLASAEEASRSFRNDWIPF